MSRGWRIFRWGCLLTIGAGLVSLAIMSLGFAFDDLTVMLVGFWIALPVVLVVGVALGAFALWSVVLALPMLPGFVRKACTSPHAPVRADESTSEA